MDVLVGVVVVEKVLCACRAPGGSPHGRSRSSRMPYLRVNDDVSRQMGCSRKRATGCVHRVHPVWCTL